MIINGFDSTCRLEPVLAYLNEPRLSKAVFFSLFLRTYLMLERYLCFVTITYMAQYEHFSSMVQITCYPSGQLIRFPIHHTKPRP